MAELRHRLSENDGGQGKDVEVARIRARATLNEPFQPGQAVVLAEGYAATGRGDWRLVTATTGKAGVDPCIASFAIVLYR